MRRWTVILFPLMLTLVSCDRNAQNFAKQANAMLDEYVVRIDRQIEAESRYYQRDAVLEVKHQHENLLNSTKADRAERRSELAADLTTGTKTALRIRTYLREFAQSEYTRRRDTYTGEVDATRVYLAKLQALQADKDRVEALGKLLDGLSQKLSLMSEIASVQQTVGGAKTDFDKLICDDNAAKLKTATGKDKESREQLQKDQCSTGGETK